MSRIDRDDDKTENENWQKERLRGAFPGYIMLIVYPKSHQLAVNNSPDQFFGVSPPPCGVNDVKQNQNDSLKSKMRVPSSFPYACALFE